jgi:hypothetical protein
MIMNLNNIGFGRFPSARAGARRLWGTLIPWLRQSSALRPRP